MKASELYQAFHGTNPKVRKVRYVPPKEPLVAIGIVSEISYRPYGSSRRKGQIYQHAMGDTGTKKLGPNSILCTDSRGKNFYIIKLDSGKKFPLFSERGIIG